MRKSRWHGVSLGGGSLGLRDSMMEGSSLRSAKDVGSEGEGSPWPSSVLREVKDSTIAASDAPLLTAVRIWEGGAVLVTRSSLAWA